MKAAAVAKAAAEEAAAETLAADEAVVAAEKAAKKAQIGLWNANDPVRPATWRATHTRQ